MGHIKQLLIDTDLEDIAEKMAHGLASIDEIALYMQLEPIAVDKDDKGE